MSSIIKLPEAAVRVEPTHKNITVQARVSRSETPFAFKNGDVRLTMVIPNPDDPTQTRRVQARFGAADGWNAELVSKFLPRGATCVATLDLYPPRDQVDKDNQLVLDPRTQQPFYNQTVVLSDVKDIVRPQVSKMAQMAMALTKASAPKADAAEQL